MLKKSASFVLSRSISSRTSRLLKQAVCRLVKKISEARRAKNRRAEAYLGGTLERLCLERESFPRRLSTTFINACLKQAVGI